MAITRSSVHVSVPVEQLYRDLMLGAESIQKGVLQVIPGKRKQVTLNRFFSGVQNITARVATPTTAADALTKDEKQIVMAEIMFYDTFDPKEFNVEAEFLWSQGPTVDAQGAAVLLAAIRGSVTTAFNYDLENLIWNGDTLSGDAWLDPIDGLLKIIDADGTVISATPAGAAGALGTPANVLAAMENVVAACPAAVQELSSPTIVMSHTDKYLYYQALRDETYKGIDITQAGKDLFAGFPIVSTHGIPAGRIFMMNTGGGDPAECKMATWPDADRFNVKIDRLQPNSDLFFIKINAEVGVNYVYGKQIVEHTPAV